MTDKTQIETIKSMLKSDNVDDINLAGSLIINSGLFDQNLMNFMLEHYTASQVINIVNSKYEHFLEMEYHVSTTWIKDPSRCGELILNNE